jgi:hypothetical protein
MKSVMAAAKANEGLAENASKLVGILGRFGNDPSQVAAITAAATGDATNLTVGQMDDMT